MADVYCYATPLITVSVPVATDLSAVCVVCVVGCLSAPEVAMVNILNCFSADVNYNQIRSPLSVCAYVMVSCP